MMPSALRRFYGLLTCAVIEWKKKEYFSFGYCRLMGEGECDGGLCMSS